MKAEDNKNFNKKYGFWPGRSFSLWSEQPNHRRLYAHPNQYLYTQNDREGAPNVHETFYFDLKTKMVKSRYGNWSITFNWNSNKLARCMPNMKSRWYDMQAFDGNYIVNERGLVLDAVVDRAMNHAYFKPRNTKLSSQRWNLVYRDEWKPVKTGTFVAEYGLHHNRKFVIQSQLPTRRLLSYISGKAVIKTDVSQKYQQFFFDYWAKCIKTSVNSQCMQQQSIDGRGHGPINFAGSNQQTTQMFSYRGAYLVNAARGKVLDVSGGRDVEAQPTLAYSRHNGKNQHWRIIYLDQKKPAPTKGLNKEFGFFIDRPFIIQSALFEEMYASAHGNRYGYLMVRSNPPRT